MKQESHISWDEEGAEASAYTDMGISATSAMIPEGEEVELRLYKPKDKQKNLRHSESI